MSTPQTDRGKVIYEEIRTVLLQNWDPIGVSGTPEAQDEYDAYVGPIYRLLASGADERALSDFLYTTETKTMGLVRLGARRRLKSIVSKLRQIDLNMNS